MSFGSMTVKYPRPPNCTHYIFTFTIPYAIPINNGIYKIIIGDLLADLSIWRIQKRNIGEWIVGGDFPVQMSIDKYGLFSFSYIEIKIPIEFELFKKGRRFNFFKGVPSRIKDKEVILQFLNRFIEVVKTVTEEYWIEPVRYHDILSYTVSYWDGKKRYRAGYVTLEQGVGDIKFVLPSQNVNKDEISIISNILENEDEVDLSKLFYLNAKDAFLQEDYRLALVEAITSFEIILYKFIKKHHVEIRVKNVEDYIRNKGLKKKFERILYFLKLKNSSIEDKTIKNIMKAIEHRNQILHEGYRKISPSECELELFSLEEIIKNMKILLIEQ